LIVSTHKTHPHKNTLIMRALYNSRHFSGDTTIIIVICCTVMLIGCGYTQSGLLDGSKTAPDFQIEAFGNENYNSGQTIDLSHFHGQPIVINFWFPSCPPCRLEMPDLEKIWKTYRSSGVQFIGIQQVGVDSVNDGQSFIKANGITYLTGPDKRGNISVDYNILAYPTTIFVSKEHKVIRSWTGTISEKKLEQLVQELLK